VRQPAGQASSSATRSAEIVRAAPGGGGSSERGRFRRESTRPDEASGRDALGRGRAGGAVWPAAPGRHAASIAPGGTASCRRWERGTRPAASHHGASRPSAGSARRVRYAAAGQLATAIPRRSARRSGLHFPGPQQPGLQY
jgi:hypothetical protein